MQLTIIKGALVPSSDIERVELHKALKKAGIESKIGVSFDVAVINPRNAKFNAKIFAGLTEIAKMLGIDINDLRAEIMYDMGAGRDVKLRGTDKFVTVLPSMSKTSMSEKELTDFWDAAQLYCEREVLISLDPEQQARVKQIFAADAVNPLGAG